MKMNWAIWTNWFTIIENISAVSAWILFETNLLNPHLFYHSQKELSMSIVINLIIAIVCGFVTVMSACVLRFRHGNWQGIATRWIMASVDITIIVFLRIMMTPYYKG